MSQKLNIENINFTAIKTVFLLAVAIVLTKISAIAEQQYSKGQIMSRFMKAEMFLRRGQDSLAIAQFDTVTMMVPQFPISYLRQAKIYEDMYHRNNSQSALNAAVVMYRRYLTFEFNEKRIEEPMRRLRELEDLLKIEHFEDLEKADSQVELTQGNEPEIITSDAEASKISSRTEVQLHSEPDKETLSQISFLSLYGIEQPKYTEDYSQKDTRMEPVTGHWVSSLKLQDGRETWIFDILPKGDDEYLVIFSNESGIINQPKSKPNFVKRLISYFRTKNVFSNTTSEIVNSQTVASVKNNQVSFTFEIEREYQPSKNIYNWARNLLKNVSGYLPFSSVVTNFANNTVTNYEKNDVAKVSSTIYTFSCRQKSNGIMNVVVNSIEKTTNKTGHARSRAGRPAQMTLYRTDDDYSYYSEDDDYNSNSIGYWEDFAKQVENDAATNDHAVYVLATLHQYGIGFRRDENKAVKIMQELAVTERDNNAKRWLVNYYYHQAYNNDNRSTSTRRKYLASANYWAEKIQTRDLTSWYGIKGDLFYGDQMRDISNALLDSAVVYYRKGAEAGDTYSQCRLGQVLGGTANNKSNLDETVKWLTIAADSGNSEAHLELGRVLLRRKDKKGYLLHVGLAADMGNPEAFTELAEAYSGTDGKFGVEANYQQACKMRMLANRAEHDEWINTATRYGYDISQYLVK